MLNLRDPLFANHVALRHALAHQVAARACIDLMLSGRGTVARGLVPEGMWADAAPTGAQARACDRAQRLRVFRACPRGASKRAQSRRKAQP